MDQMVVELPDRIPAAIGDAVSIMGGAADGSPSVDEIADLMATNTYEVLVGLRRRIPRVYVRQDSIVGVRTGASDSDFAVSAAEFS